jgi:hypothetical protein
MNNGMECLLILEIFFGIMFISYWLKEIAKELKEIKYRL